MKIACTPSHVITMQIPYLLSPSGARNLSAALFESMVLRFLTPLRSVQNDTRRGLIFT